MDRPKYVKLSGNSLFLLPFLSFPEDIALPAIRKIDLKISELIGFWSTGSSSWEISSSWGIESLMEFEESYIDSLDLDWLSSKKEGSSWVSKLNQELILSGLSIGGEKDNSIELSFGAELIFSE